MQDILQITAVQDPMEPIYIPRLTRAPEQTETVQFSEMIPDLETLTPVQGWVKVKHQGNYLEVTAKADTIITLACNRCLQQYNYRLAIAPSELIWLDESSEKVDPMLLLDQDISPEDLVESLSPTGHFDPTTWVYEQLCLEIPQRQLCDPQCQGIQLPKHPSSPLSTVDRRWASLETLKDQLSDHKLSDNN
jgi:uncharacterized protein